MPFSFKTIQRFLIPVLILFAAFLRLYNVPASLMFQGDQGRDALIVSQIFTKGDLVFIGPVTSVGNMYLGPLYYYFMLPFLALSYPSPVGPAYAVAALGILTVYLLYRWGRELIGTRGAVIATFLMTFSVSAIFYSRFSWNPNPAPIVGLGMIYATYLAWKKHPWYWAVVGLCFSILIQLHYLTLVSAGGAGLIWLLHLKDVLSASGIPASERSKRLRQLLTGSLMALVILAVSLTPLMLFDSKHEWLNARAFRQLLTKDATLSDDGTDSLVTKIPKTIKETHGRSMHILFEHTLGKHRTLNTGLVAVTLVVFVGLLMKKDRPTRAGETVIASYLATGILGTAVYEHSVFDHYIAYLFPVAFLTMGIVLGWLSQRLVGKILVCSFILFFLSFNLPRLPLKSNAWSIFDVQRVTSSIYQRLEPGEKYSLVLLAPSKDLYGQNYRYFLSTTDKAPLPPERAGEADTLVVINEEHVASVSALPIYEITIFPQKTADETYTIDQGPEIIIYRKP